MRPGVRLGVDVGRARVGVAVCDRDGLLATPVVSHPRGKDDEGAFRGLIEEYSPIEIIVGLPLSLAGTDTPSTADAREFAHWLTTLGGPPVRLVDERMSTVSAQRGLHQAGRNTRTSRAVIDQAAAVIILQNALDFERSAGRPAGTAVAPDEGL